MSAMGRKQTSDVLSLALLMAENASTLHHLHPLASLYARRFLP